MLSTPTRGIHQGTLTRLLLALLLGTVTLAPLHATVLVELSFEELVEDSQLIFQGHVLRSEATEVDGLQHTTFWFAVDEVIKGEPQNAELPLRFLGSNSTDGTMVVEGQYFPTVGDHAVYFVSDPHDFQVNPLTGWHQGAFLLENSATGELLLDLSQRPDLILFNTQAEPLARKMLDLQFSEDAIADKLPGYYRFTLDDFKAAIRSLVPE